MAIDYENGKWGGFYEPPDPYKRLKAATLAIQKRWPRHCRPQVALLAPPAAPPFVVTPERVRSALSQAGIDGVHVRGGGRHGAIALEDDSNGKRWSLQWEAWDGEAWDGTDPRTDPSPADEPGMADAHAFVLGAAFGFRTGGDW